MTGRIAAVFVLAVAILCSGAALAQGSMVQIYGTLLPFGEVISIKDATAPGLSPAFGGASQVPAARYTGAEFPSQARLTSGTSNIGFRGSEDLGGGWKAIFQLESQLFLDSGGGNLGGRNSNVGFTGPYGTIFYGIWDTPYKWTTLAIAPLRGLNPFDYDIILENPGFNVPGTTTQSTRVNNAADAAFSRRQGNSVQYWTPTFFGFSGRLAYSPGEAKTTGSAVTPSTNPWIVSAALNFEYAGFMLRYAYEQHDDYFGMSQIGGSVGATLTNPSSKDTGNKVVAFYTFAPTNTKLMGTYEWLDYKNNDVAAGAVRQYKRNAYYLSVQQRFGSNLLWAAYGNASDGSCSRGGAPCTTNGLGADQWTLGYAYSFSKRTDVYAAVYKVNNDRSGSYGVFPPAATVAPGGDTFSGGIGILHSF